MKIKVGAKGIIYLLLVGFACNAVLLYFYNRRGLSRLCHEDGVVEWLTAVFYFLASFIFIYACKQHGFKNVWYWGFSILFFVIAGEEISWGQRLFGFSTPELIRNINVQKEINLHNIKGVQGNIRGVGLLLIFGICYFIPITDRFITRLRSFYKRIRMPVYPLWIIGITTIAVLFMAVPRLLFHRAIFNLDEMGEMYLSMGFLLFSLSELKRHKIGTGLSSS